MIVTFCNFNETIAVLTKDNFLAIESIKVKCICGFSIARTRPGKPAPVPTSAILFPLF